MYVVSLYVSLQQVKASNTILGDHVYIILHAFYTNASASISRTLKAQSNVVWMNKAAWVIQSTKYTAEISYKRWGVLRMRYRVTVVDKSTWA